MVFTVLIATLFFWREVEPEGIPRTNSSWYRDCRSDYRILNFSSSLSFTAPGHILILAATFLWGVDNNVTSAITERVNVARIIQIKSIISGAGLFLIAFLEHDLVVKI